jgi:hypothetical protein
MSIRIGIYDFFAYTIPGALMLLIILGFLDALGIQDMWIKFHSLNTFQVVLSIVSCYLAGYVFNPFLAKWSGFFEAKDFVHDTLAQLKMRNPEIVANINHVDWPIWMASIRRENLDLAFEIDRFLAIAKMLRGASIFLLFGGIIILVYVLNSRFSAWYLPITIVSTFLSILMVKESIKHKRWFYFVIFETVISRQEPFNFQTEPQNTSNSTHSKD